MAGKGKRLAAAYKSVDAAKLHALPEAVELIKGNANAKFDETVEPVSYTHLTLPTM